MAAMLEKTRHAGIYKRGSRYIVRYRANGKRHAESCRTLDEALKLKRAREAARDRGEHDLVAEGRMTLREFGTEWAGRYMGNGKRGFTENTREEYKRDLARYAYPFLGDRRLNSIAPRDISNWIAWLCDPVEQGKRLAAERSRQVGKNKRMPESPKAGVVNLSDATVRRILAPVRACLSTARREGLIRGNPCDGVALPNRPKILSGDDDETKALTEAELAVLLQLVPVRWKTFFRTLAATGMRWSEIIAVRWEDLTLDGSSAHVHVRQAYVNRKFKPPKSEHGRRKIPLSHALCAELRAARRGSSFGAPADLVFPSKNGSPLRYENVRRRVLAPAAEEAGVSWCTFHTFRHTCASVLFARGRNPKQVQKWLGHHSPAFTMSVYVHLLGDGVGDALDLDDLGESKMSPGPRQTDADQRIAELEAQLANAGLEPIAKTNADQPESLAELLARS